jgi:hypothetical protein
MDLFLIRVSAWPPRQGYRVAGLPLDPRQLRRFPLIYLRCLRCPRATVGLALGPRPRLLSDKHTAGSVGPRQRTNVPCSSRILLDRCYPSDRGHRVKARKATP